MLSTICHLRLASSSQRGPYGTVTGPGPKKRTLGSFDFPPGLLTSGPPVYRPPNLPVPPKPPKVAQKAPVQAKKQRLHALEKLHTAARASRSCNRLKSDLLGMPSTNCKPAMLASLVVVCTERLTWPPHSCQTESCKRPFGVRAIDEQECKAEHTSGQQPESADIDRPHAGLGFRV